MTGISFQVFCSRTLNLVLCSFHKSILLDHHVSLAASALSTPNKVSSQDSTEAHQAKTKKVTSGFKQEDTAKKSECGKKSNFTVNHFAHYPLSK